MSVSSGQTQSINRLENVTAAKTTKAVLAGMDLGTTVSVVLMNDEGVQQKLGSDLIPTVIGLPKEGVLPGIIPAGKSKLYGNEALNYRVHCKLVWPVAEGFVAEHDLAREFIADIRRQIDPNREREFWIVVGSPANATLERQRDIRRAYIGSFERMLIVPEPFLAALGYREDERLGDPGYEDPIRSSLFVDIGAGTTDLCMVLGYYPGSKEQISFPKAGNDVDRALEKAIRKRYPDAGISPTGIRAIKEKYSFVGDAHGPVVIKAPSRGKMREMEISACIREACEVILGDIIAAIEELASRCDPDALPEMLKNIILTGGGSCIRNLPESIEAKLRALGYESARVIKVPEYKKLVAMGALKMAKAVRPDQWQILV